MKPEKARGVEDVILRAAQMGQIAEKVWCIILISLSVLYFPHGFIFSSQQSIYKSSSIKETKCLELQLSGFRGEAYFIVGTDQQPNNQADQSHCE